MLADNIGRISLPDYMKEVKNLCHDGLSHPMVRPKGPYRVIDEANPGSYNLQRLPFLQGGGKPGKIVKESAFRMERIPSTLVLHKRTDAADSRFLAMNQRPATTPLEKWLRVIECGAYKKAAEDEDYAFKQLANMWSARCGSVAGHGHDRSCNIESSNGDAPFKGTDMRLEESDLGRSKQLQVVHLWVVVSNQWS